ncbi:MAG: hypothetical protein C4B59_05235 [Candidatus Methanogaster sp.]|uniref:Uncharacterized protein n=1 Tax=Candidatus Methanogaster sp. TaxID=3386292 RepID=A0AC61L575_9EURY|nr:MAG: hypothetical protein C4B59_05235 [ANME-2 cluster archaeon]
MYSGETNSAWHKKGGTLSDKSARKEFGITQEEIIDAIRDGRLQYRTNNVFGNPYLRLIRSEVEAFVDEKYGNEYLTKKKTRNELAQTNKELKKLKAQAASLEKRKTELIDILDE